MYRIQAYNFVTKLFTVRWTDCMVERQRIIDALIATGEYTPAGITLEWMPRKGRGA